MKNAHSKQPEKAFTMYSGSVTCSPACHFKNQMSRQHVTARCIDSKRVTSGVSFKSFISRISMCVRIKKHVFRKCEFFILYIGGIFFGNVTCHMTRLAAYTLNHQKGVRL